MTLLQETAIISLYSMNLSGFITEAESVYWVFKSVRYNFVLKGLGCSASCYESGSKLFRPDQLFKMTEIKQLFYFSIQSPFISTHTDTLTSP